MKILKYIIENGGYDEKKNISFYIQVATINTSQFYYLHHKRIFFVAFPASI